MARAWLPIAPHLDTDEIARRCGIEETPWRVLRLLARAPSRPPPPRSPPESA